MTRLIVWRSSDNRVYVESDRQPAYRFPDLNGITDNALFRRLLADKLAISLYLFLCWINEELPEFPTENQFFGERFIGSVSVPEKDADPSRGASAGDQDELHPA